MNSKELLEKTGISRATLNNYIALGIVPKPDVLPPGPQDGAAPRIGYFPEDTVQRITDIQRLKNEGWSMAAIAEHFDAGQTGARGAQPLPRIAPPGPAAAAPGSGGPPRLSVDHILEPAYLVDRDFALLWTNAAGAAALGPSGVAADVVQALASNAGTGFGLADEVLRFHLAVAKQQGIEWPRLAGGLPPAERSRLQGLFEQTNAAGPGPLWHRQVGTETPGTLYAVQFREGTLFVRVPRSPAGDELSAQLASRELRLGHVARPQRPALSEVAVLAMDLQDAARIWSALPAEEYFELINQIWVATEPIVRRHHGIDGKHPGDGIVCYFMPQRDTNHAWNALLAAHEVREAMRRVSKEWQLRKGWTNELYMNAGLDAGQQWLGTLRAGSQAAFTMFGEILNRAIRISDFARFGAVWATKHLIVKLAPEEMQRVRYGVQRRDRQGRHHFVSSVFATVDRLADATTLGSRMQDIARLPVTEIVDIAAPPVRRPGEPHPN